MSTNNVAQALLRPRAASAPQFWIQRHPSGARVLLAEGTETRELAAAVAKMVAKVTASPKASRDVAPCTCGDCLSCELGAMRSRRAVRHG